MLVDFDGTAAAKDVQEYVLDTFTDGVTWREINREWANGAITTAQRAQRQWALLSCSESELLACIATVELDPYFAEFVRLCTDRHYPLYIVSDGFDFYINLILEQAGLGHLVVIANSLKYVDGAPQMTFLHQRSADQYYGNDKVFVLEQVRLPESTTTFVGDGYSDRDVAGHADLVFAKDDLAEYCQQHGVPYQPYSTFREVIEYFSTHKS